MSHSFLKESKLYLEYGSSMYRIYTTTAISYSQTFAEDSYPVKTLHDQSKMFEGTTITKANPASFSFGVPLTGEKDESIVMDLISDLVSTSDSGIQTQQLKSFNMYVKTGASTFKIEGCVITTASLDFGVKDQFLINVEGQGTKLTRVGDETFSLGTIQSDFQLDGTTRTPKLIYPVVTVIDDTETTLDMNHITQTTLQIQNNITWTQSGTLHKSLNATMIYPTTYTLDNRVVSGAITQYQIGNNRTQFNDFSTKGSITIKAVEVGKASSDNGFWAIQLNPAMFTARMEVGDIYTNSYDFRSTDNTALGTRITQYS